MPDMATLFLFAAACVALTATPGPDMLLIVSRSVTQGRASGVVTLAGIQVGTYAHAAAAALGLSQLFLLVPIAYDVVRWAGAVYLLYLAWTTLRSAGSSVGSQPISGSSQLVAIFRQGLVTNLLNPKMALFVVALFPQFVNTDAGSVGLQIMLLATILNLIGLVVNGAVILTAAHSRRFLISGGRFAHLPGYCLSAVFAGLALRLALAGRD
jgi:threonine/homoserine/homoserine lactone efflux protein